MALLPLSARIEPRSCDDTRARAVLASGAAATPRLQTTEDTMAATLPRPAVYRTALVATLVLAALGRIDGAIAANPWDTDPAVQEVLELRRQGIAAMTSGGASVAV